MFNQDELEKIKQKALEEHIPILMDDTLEKIEEILKQEKPKRILEIGTAVGYSASMFAKFTSDDCIIDTIGNAVEILPTLNETYDIVFIDAAKGKYPIFLQEGLRMVKNEGIILADNILYKGYVMSDYNAHKQRTAVRHLREYIKEIMENDKCESEILETGDGLAITRVKK